MSKCEPTRISVGAPVGPTHTPAEGCVDQLKDEAWRQEAFTAEGMVVV